MKLIIKVLNGDECTIDAAGSWTILDVKNEIEKQIKIAAIHQKLLNVGRTLLDENTIDSYSNIKDGTKLILVIKKAEGLKEIISRCFRKYYNEQESEKLATEFMLDFEKKIKQFSLDDIERLAVELLASQSDEQ